MNIKCDFCGSMIDERSEKCPHCGAPLSGVNRMAVEQPKTIEELAEWYASHNLPPEEVTRFFIGKDIKEPRAFGIYKTEVGDCVVYKNKSDGERVVRYRGADEAYAVNELYQRLRAEIADQKEASRERRADERKPMAPNPEEEKRRKKKKRLKGCGCLLLLFFLVIGGIGAIANIDPTPNGYYKYQDTEYYHYGTSWYRYDAASDDWLEAESMSKVITEDNADQFSYSDHKGKAFTESSWYSSSNSYSHDDDDDDWDSDNSWDSDDSWDNSSTDWDSDW